MVSVNNNTNEQYKIKLVSTTLKK